MANISMEQKVLSVNDTVASKLRKTFQKHKIFVINIVSSPGSGKTSLLEKTVQLLDKNIQTAIIAGDVQTENDANRILKAGGKFVQPIETGGSCHLDAAMIEKSITHFDLDKLDLLIIENVGNLVCPSCYDLGEDMKVVLVSTTEGDDKPLKYPSIFRNSSVMVINKTDLLKYTDFKLDKVRKNALQINGAFEIFETSCKTSDGLDEWIDWLTKKVSEKG